MSTLRKTIVFVGDVVLLYGALALTLIIRYKISEFDGSFAVHLLPFSTIFIFWLLVFYLNDLYQDKNLRIKQPTAQSFAISIGVSFFLSISLFYLFAAFFNLTPRANLMIFSILFGFLDFGWRYAIGKIYSKGIKSKILVIGESKIINEIISYLSDSPHIGYEIVGHIKSSQEASREIIDRMLLENKVDTLILQPELEKNQKMVKMAYRLLMNNVSILNPIDFYEDIFKKIPLEEINEEWFIEKIFPRHRIYDAFKRITDFVLSFVLLICLSPFILIAGFLVLISSRGPIIFSQERIGSKNQKFVLYKFRTMKVGHNGPLWTEENDNRFTWAGGFLRSTHLDELPQLWNIFKGNISFVGPRPERFELVEEYKQLPYYDIRHTIKPGLTGWAQISFKPSASVEEAFEKLKYDIFYIKNRSFILDFIIMFRTTKSLFGW